MTIHIICPNNKGKLLHLRTTKHRRAYNFIQAAKKLPSTFFDIRVVYGKAKNVFGQSVVFSNEGRYQTIKEAKRALSAFLTEKFG